MQVTFNGHDYLFVNPRLAGKSLPPNEDEWFNYGGDKLWLLPEGDDDEQHWRGNSDLIDAGEFTFEIFRDGIGCGAELTGPPDPHTPKCSLHAQLLLIQTRRILIFSRP